MDAHNPILERQTGEAGPAVNMPKYDANKHLFTLLLVAGVALSWAVRAYFDGGTEMQSAIIATAICLVCLAYYCVHAYLSLGSIDSHAPENLYYMGLLFTLASLAYSLTTLFVFNDGGSDSIAKDDAIEERVYNLVGSFGIALASTFFGILFRILLLQKIHAPTSMPRRPKEDGKTIIQGQPESMAHDHAQIAHRDLTDAAFRLRRELTQTIADMGVFRDAIIQATQETVNEADKARAAMVQQVEKAASEQASMLATLAGKIGEKLAKAGDDAAAAAGNVKELLDELVKQQEKQRQDLIAMGKASAEQLAGGIREMLGKISGEGENIGAAFNSTLAHLQNVARDLQETQTGIGALASGYNALNTEIMQTTKLFSGAASEVERVAKAISADTKVLSESMAKTADIAPQYTEQFSQQIKVLRQEAEQWQSMTQEVRTTMLEAVKSLTDAIKRK